MIVSATTLLRHLSVSEPGAVATGSSTHLDPVATTTPRGCPAGDPGSLAVLTRRVII